MISVGEIYQGFQPLWKSGKTFENENLEKKNTKNRGKLRLAPRVQVVSIDRLSIGYGENICHR